MNMADENDPISQDVIPSARAGNEAAAPEQTQGGATQGGATQRPAEPVQDTAAQAPAEPATPQTAPGEPGSLAALLLAAARAAAGEASAAPLAVVLGRAFDEAQSSGQVEASTQRMLRAALAASRHNPHLSDSTRATLAAVAQAL